MTQSAPRIDVLADEGFLEESKGARGARLFRSSRPYRESEDDHQDAVDSEDTTSPRPLPDLSLDLTSTHSSTSPTEPPYGGDGRGEVDLSQVALPNLSLVAAGAKAPSLPADAPDWEHAYQLRKLEREL